MKIASSCTHTFDEGRIYRSRHANGDKIGISTGTGIILAIVLNQPTAAAHTHIIRLGNT